MAADTPTSTCSICEAVAERKPVQGALPDEPAGWADLTLHQRAAPEVHLLLCRACNGTMRSVFEKLRSIARARAARAESDDVEAGDPDDD